MYGLSQRAYDTLSYKRPAAPGTTVDSIPDNRAWVVSTLAGDGTPGSKNGVGTAAWFNRPLGIAADSSSGNIYVADTSNHRVRKITIASNGTARVSTLAGDGTPGSKDGVGTAARFNSPRNVAVDSSSGNIYVADRSNHRIRKITAAGVVTTIAGGSSNNQPEYGTTNGVGTAALFRRPIDVAVDSSGNIYVVDYVNNRIRKIEYK